MAKDSLNGFKVIENLTIKNKELVNIVDKYQE